VPVNSPPLLGSEPGAGHRRPGLTIGDRPPDARAERRYAAGFAKMITGAAAAGARWPRVPEPRHHSAGLAGPRHRRARAAERRGPGTGHGPRGSRSPGRRRARVACHGGWNPRPAGQRGSRPRWPGPSQPRRAVRQAGPVGPPGTCPQRARGAAPDRTSVGSAIASGARAAEAASAAVPGLPAAPRPAPSTARGTDVHKQDHRDRTIPAAVIVVVFFVAILVAALIWLAAS
jgi:hypothetical protein